VMLSNQTMRQPAVNNLRVKTLVDSSFLRAVAANSRVNRQTVAMMSCVRFYKPVDTRTQAANPPLRLVL
jgi:hypothetical protein